MFSNMSEKNYTDCAKFLECLRCNVNGCLKCPKFIMWDSKQCVENCPVRYISQWSTNPEIMGRMCVLSNFYNSAQTIFTGLIIGLILCFLILFFGVTIFRRKQQQMHRRLMKDQLIDDEQNKSEFSRQLEELRPYAICFLVILNNIRKELRKSYIAENAVRSTKLHKIIRDVAKILILLNRPVDLIDDPPHDWNQLLQCVQIILAHYKSFDQPECNASFDMNVKSSPFKSLFYSTPVTQIRRTKIPSSLPSTANTNCRNTINFHRPDKLDLNNDSSVKGSLISLQEFINDSSVDTNDHNSITNYYNSLEHIKNYLSNGSLLVVEDELIEFKLGLRPQDEISTEL